MMQTHWKKELHSEINIVFALPDYRYSHIASQQFDLQSDDGLTNPHDGKDSREDLTLLLVLRPSTKQETQQKAEKQRTPSSMLASSPYTTLFAQCQTHQRSQSLNPSLIPLCKTTSASGHLPTSPLSPPARLSPCSLSAPPIPPPLCISPPRRYLGYKTWRIFSQTARRSLDSVAQTDSSRVFWGARRSSPGIVELR